MTRRRLLWVTGVAVVVVVATVIWQAPFDWSQTSVQQAGLAAVVVASGWFAGFFLREIGIDLDRAERLRDMHRALYAEIQHNLENLGTVEDLQKHGSQMLALIHRDPEFVPFIPRERNDTVFQAIVEELHILPRTSIDPVVRYYSQLAAMDALVDDMRGDTFKDMAEGRRAAIYQDYIGIRMRLIDYGTEATRAINAYAKGGRGAAERLAAAGPTS